ncbi:MAG: hypothetical protein O2798_10800, partial [Chloroflexi bacterium]|nr:hypothetical protein [Chloroflexota bacterium]
MAQPAHLTRWTVIPATIAVVCMFVIAACGSPEPSGDADSRVGGPAEIRVRWHVDGTVAATVAIHEPPPGQALYEVRTYLAGDTPEAGPLIEDATLRTDFGEPRRFIAVLRNESDEPLRFWVTPHLPAPHLAADGLLMFCLCTGETYEVPGGGTWTRVMEFGVTRRSGLQGPLTLTHVIVPGEPPWPRANVDP